MVHNHKPAWHSGQFGPVWESWIRVNSELIRLFCEHLTLFKVLLIFGVLLSIWLLTLASNWSKSLKCPNHRGNLGRPEKVEIFVNYRVNLTILCILILNLIYIIWLILSLFKNAFKNKRSGHDKSKFAKITFFGISQYKIVDWSSYFTEMFLWSL